MIKMMNMTEKNLARTRSEPGRVQRRAYQLYLLKVRSDERLARLRGQPVTVKTLEEIQREYETRFGTRFINI